METIEEFAKFRTVRGDSGLLGLEYRGEMITGCEYDEITRLDKSFLCRKTNYVQYVNFDGEVFYYEESNDETEDETELNDGFIQTWEKGKYGVLSPSREVILPAVYDDVFKWRDCDVIYARRGTEARYFDLEGNEILRDVRTIKGANDKLMPYYDGEPQTNVIQLMDMSDNTAGDDFCQCHGRRAGLSRRLCPEHFEYMQGMANVVPLDDAGRDSFLAWDCYIYASFAVQSAPGCKYPVCDCIDQLSKIGAYRSSWWWMYLVLYPEDAVIDLEKDRWLFRCLDLDMGGNSVNGVAFGRSKDVSHGVKIIATRYFRDHWPSEDEWREGAPDRDRSLRNLSRFFSSHVEKRRQLLDESFETIIRHCGNYIEKHYSWRQKKEKLDWLIAHGARIPEASIWKLMDTLYIYPDRKRIVFNTLLWLIRHGADVNYVKDGQTPLDIFDENPWVRKMNVFPFKQLLKAHGARTLHDIRAEESRARGFDKTIMFSER